MKVQYSLIFALLFALITAVFAVVNVEPVMVNFLFVEAEIPLILVILGSTLLGGLIVGLFGIIRQYRLQKKISTLEKEIAQLKPTTPSATSHESNADKSTDQLNPSSESVASEQPAEEKEKKSDDEIRTLL